MSFKTNQLLAKDRAQRDARQQARQARWNATVQRNQAAQHAAQLAAQHAQQLAFAAQNPGIHPGLVFQNVGVHWNPNPHGHFLPSIQHPAFQHAVFQVPAHMNTAVFGAHRPNPAFQPVPAIQNVPAVNTAVPAQATKPKRKRVTKIKPKQPLKDVPFPLMELPLEIRTMIYKHLLEENSNPLTLLTQGLAGQEKVRRGFLNKQDKPSSGRQVLHKIIHKANDKDITHLTPAILRACELIHQEAIPILYGQTLEFEYPIALQKFLFSIGPNNRLLLQRIVLRGWQPDVFPVWQQAIASAFERLMSAQNLKSILMDRHTSSGTDRDGVRLDPKDWDFKAEHLSERIEFWAQYMDTTKGKGSARSLLLFSDRNFNCEDDIVQEFQNGLERKKVFLEKLKLSYK